MIIKLEKAGTNPDQRHTAELRGPDGGEFDSLTVGEVFHIEGQPEDVKWRIVEIVTEAVSHQTHTRPDERARM